MEPDASIESARMIRVAVVAVGNIPSAQLRDYVALVLRQKVVPLQCASLFYKEHQKSPFAQQSWETGSLCFKFLVGGAPKSPWEDFQAHRKCLGVIGLIHCPTTPDIGAAYDNFMAICKGYPSAQEKRCFALYPRDGQVELDDKKRQHLVMFPPDRQILESHMQTLMQDFAASLLMAFESWVLHAEPVGAILTTPLDSQASLNSEEVSKAKKRRLGRIQKTIGDYCLLAGSPVDANAHYSTAIDLARLTGDLFWHAGAIEGFVSALVVHRGGLKDPQLEDEVKLRYYEIISLYRRATALSFELEAILKLARFLDRRELASYVSDMLTSAVESSKALLDASDRLVLNVEVSRILGGLGYERKAAFYARQVAQLYQQQDSCWAAMSALQVLTLTSRTYRVQSKAAACAKANTLMELLQEKDVSSNSGKAQDSSQEVGADGQWSTLQMDILGDMLAAAVRAGDPLAAWSAAARLVRGHYPLITPSAQFGLATALTTAAERLPRGTRCSDPALPFVRLHSYPRLPPEMEVVKRFAGKKDWWVGASSAGPFIYTPAKGNENETKAEVIWVVGETMQVLVDLANPCAFEVNVESISLSVESGEIEAFPVSVLLPPNTSQVVSLSGLPLSVGSLVVRGCIVQCFGVITEHLFEEGGELFSGVALSDPFRSVGGPRITQSIPTSIEVMPPLPLLVAEVVGGEGAVVLYEGEIREMHIRLANAGVVPVVEATMTLTGKQREHVLSLGHDILNAALPLVPGACVVIPVRLKAGQPTTEPEFFGSKGHGLSTGKPSKDPACPMLVIYYAGPPVETRDIKTKAVVPPSLPPGRRLGLPLQLHVLRGLYLEQARLLSMEVPAQVSRSLPDPENTETPPSPSTLVKIDPYRGSWSLLLLELELRNATDVLFEISVSVNSGKEGIDEETADDGDVKDTLYPSTRIDQNHSARVLIPLDRFKLPGLDKAFLARTLAKKYGLTKQDSKARESAERQAKAELNATIEELSSRIRVKWHSGRNSAGELPIKDAIRGALKLSAIEILLPDPLTFGFRLARSSRNSSFQGLSLVANDGQGKTEDSDQVNSGTIGSADSVVAHELTAIEMLVRNNTHEAVTLTLSVTCRDVTGASCLGSTQAKTTVLWAGALNGVDVQVPALGEVVHAFALCFMVPGQYTLLGAAVINDLPDDSLVAKAKVPFSEIAQEPLCYSGPPFTVNVTGIS
ncbi:hypothetical protein R1sor_018464 [Riccia sorocarpa]|uniref:Trafficking protein particle complex subunit 9 n=1 Tax=Riccia sorocarpa TaxID=122646 RepID=A0ABD3I9V1_9MARC